MKIFRKQTGKNKLLKLFKAVTQSEAEDFDTKPLIELILSTAKDWKLNLDNFYITGPYPNDGWKTKKGFVNGLIKKNYKNIHHLLISDSNNLFEVNFENWSHNRTIEVLSDTISLELMIDGEIASNDEIIKLAERFYSAFQFQYGFQFDQSKNFSISEGKIKNGLFSYSEKNNEGYGKWSKYASAIKDGYLRNIYCVNLISEEHLHNEILKDLAEKFGTLNRRQNFYLWKLDNNEVENVKSQLKNSELLVENDEFDSTNAYQFITQEIEKYAPQQAL
ncbi:hypothetical protein [Ekhidna sp.]